MSDTPRTENGVWDDELTKEELEQLPKGVHFPPIPLVIVPMQCPVVVEGIVEESRQAVDCITRGYFTVLFAEIELSA